MPAWQQLATWGWLPLPGGALWRRGPNDCKHASARAQGSNVFRHLATRPRRTPCTEAAIVLTRDESHLVAVQGNGAIDLAQLIGHQAAVRRVAPRNHRSVMEEGRERLRRRLDAQHGARHAPAAVLPVVIARQTSAGSGSVQAAQSPAPPPPARGSAAPRIGHDLLDLARRAVCASPLWAARRPPRAAPTPPTACPR